MFRLSPDRRFLHDRYPVELRVEADKRPGKSLPARIKAMGDVQKPITQCKGWQRAVPAQRVAVSHAVPKPSREHKPGSLYKKDLRREVE